jgi:hypothetical protein
VINISDKPIPHLAPTLILHAHFIHSQPATRSEQHPPVHVCTRTQYSKLARRMREHANASKGDEDGEIGGERASG